MRKIFIALIMALCLVANLSDAATKRRETAKKQTIRVPGGANIDRLGLAIEASYDNRLDTFVPGYKVINVALVNTALNIISLSPEDDEWSIKLANSARSFKALHDLRSQDPKAWSSIPKKAQELIGYPLVLPVGAQEVIDLFVKDTIDVEKFNEVDVFLKSINAKIEVLVRQ